MSDTPKTKLDNDYEPYIDITDGQVTGGPLHVGQTFYWYNPDSNDVAITIQNCGTWCQDSSYTIPASQQYAEAQVLLSPNQNEYAWTEVPSSVWTAGGGGPHLGVASPGQGTPLVNIQTGAVAGTLTAGQPFDWNNPNPGTVAIANCGTWCAANSYPIASGGVTAAAMATNPNGNSLAWTETPNRWDAPGMPHTQGPITVHAHKKKEVA
jgi:hypothetical protein